MTPKKAVARKAVAKKPAPKKATPPRQLIVVVGETAGEVVLHDSADGSILARIKVGFLPHEVVISPDGKTAYVTNFGLQDYDERIGIAGSSVSVIDLDLMCETHRLYTYDTETGETYHAPHGIGISPDGASLYISVEQGAKILTFDTATRKMKKPIHTPLAQKKKQKGGLADPDTFAAEYASPSALMHNMLVSHDGKTLYIMAADKDGTSPDIGVYAIDAAAGTIKAHKVLPGIHGLCYAVDQTSVTAFGNGIVYTLDPVSLKVTFQQTVASGQMLYGRTTPDGYTVIPFVWSSEVAILKGQGLASQFYTGIDPVHVVITPDGSTGYVTNARSDYISKFGVNPIVGPTAIPSGEGPNGIALAPYRPAPAKKTLRFGAVLPLQTPEGRELLVGYEYWKETVNAAGGLAVGGTAYMIETAFVDDNGTDQFMPGLITQLVQGYGVQFLFGTYPSGPHMKAAQTANQLGIPLVTSSGAATVLYQQGFKYFFGIMAPASGYLSGSVDIALAANPPAKSVILLSCDDPGALDDALTTAAELVAKGMDVLVPPGPVPGIERIQNGIWVFPHLSTDFVAAVKTAVGLNPDLVLMACHQPEAEAFVKAAAQAKLTPKGFSFSVGPSLPTFAADVGALANQLMGAAQWAPGYPIPGYDRFGSSSNFAGMYWNRYNLAASYLSAGAAACGVVYERALEAAGSIDPKKVRDALAATDTWTFYGRIILDAQGLNSTKPLLTVQDIIAADGTLTMPIIAPPQYAAGNGVIWPFKGWS